MNFGAKQKAASLLGNATCCLLWLWSLASSKKGIQCPRGPGALAHEGLIFFLGLHIDAARGVFFLIFFR